MIGTKIVTVHHGSIPFYAFFRTSVMDAFRYKILKGLFFRNGAPLFC